MASGCIAVISAVSVEINSPLVYADDPSSACIRDTLPSHRFWIVSSCSVMPPRQKPVGSRANDCDAVGRPVNQSNAIAAPATNASAVDDGLAAPAVCAAPAPPSIVRKVLMPPGAFWVAPSCGLSTLPQK